jgi:DNA-binding response OmpR family regulator
MTRILLIEDNRDLAYGLRNNFEIEGYDVEVAHDGVAGLKAFSNVKPDLTILDIMLPQLDGFRVLKTLRQKDRATPVLLLTAKGEEFDKVRGLRMGADDYVTKARFRVGRTRSERVQFVACSASRSRRRSLSSATNEGGLGILRGGHQPHCGYAYRGVAP